MADFSQSSTIYTVQQKRRSKIARTLSNHFKTPEFHKQSSIQSSVSRSASVASNAVGKTASASRSSISRSVVNPSNFECLRPKQAKESYHEHHSSRRSLPIGLLPNVRQPSKEAQYPLSPVKSLSEEDGSVQLGCLLEMIHRLLAAHEVKFTLQLLEQLTSGKPATYALEVSAVDFIQELQHFTDRVFSSSASPKGEPVSIIQSLISFPQTPGAPAPPASPAPSAQPKRPKVPLSPLNTTQKHDVELSRRSLPSRIPPEELGVEFRQEITPQSNLGALAPISSETQVEGFSPIVPFAPGNEWPDKSQDTEEPVDHEKDLSRGFSRNSNLSYAPSMSISTTIEPTDSTPGADSATTEMHDSSALQHVSQSNSKVNSLQVGDRSINNGNTVQVPEGDRNSVRERRIGQTYDDEDLVIEGMRGAPPVLRPSETMFFRYVGKNSKRGNSQLHDFVQDGDIDLDDVSLEQAAFLATPSDRFIMHPNQKFRICLDLVVLVLIIMECVTLPLALSFTILLPPFINGISLGAFCIDMIASLTTGYYHRDLLIMRRNRVVRNYLQTWFSVDFVSLFPWEEVFRILNFATGSDTKPDSGSTRTTFVRILKLGKLLRVLRLLRMAKITALVKRLQNVGLLPADLSHVKFGMAVAKMFVIFSFLSHWAACIWGWMGLPYNVDHEAAPPYSIEACTMGGPCEPGIHGSPWRQRYGLLGNYDNATQYFAALQFTAGLITGGDTPMQASLPVERFFSILVMFFSVFVISVVVGEILLIMNRRAEAKLAFDELTGQAREFMTARKVPTQMQVRVFKFLETQNMVHNGSSSHNRKFIAHLNEQLQEELVEQLNSALLVQHPFFAQIQDNKRALRQLCLEASCVLFAANEVLVEKNTPASCAHFLVTGKVRVENPVVADGKVLYLKPPSWVGDICLFVETLRRATVTAVITTETLMLQKTTVQDVCSQHVLVQSLYDSFAEQMRNDKMDALICPVCHDIGHSVETCPMSRVESHTKFKTSSRKTFLSRG